MAALPSRMSHGLFDRLVMSECFQTPYYPCPETLLAFTGSQTSRSYSSPDTAGHSFPDAMFLLCKSVWKSDAIAGPEATLAWIATKRRQAASHEQTSCAFGEPQVRLPA